MFFHFSPQNKICRYLYCFCLLEETGLCDRFPFFVEVEKTRKCSKYLASVIDYVQSPVVTTSTSKESQKVISFIFINESTFY